MADFIAKIRMTDGAQETWDVTAPTPEAARQIIKEKVPAGRIVTLKRVRDGGANG